MAKKRGFISYDKLLANQAWENNIEKYYEKSILKVVSGSLLVTVGLITLPLPTGSIFMITGGLSLIASGGVDLYKLKAKILQAIRIAIWRLK